MSKLRTICALATLVLSVATQRSSGADSVKNPVYDSWAKCKVGTWVASVTTGTLSDGRPYESHGKTKFLKANEDEVSVETTTGDEKPSPIVQKATFPALVDAEFVHNPLKLPGLKEEDSGNETLSIGDAKYSCRVIELSGETGGKPVKIKLWISTDVPGATPRMEVNVGKSKIRVDITSVNVPDK